MDSQVAEKFQSYPDSVRPKLEALRSLILEIAAQSPEIGELKETLKWGEPAYLPSQTGSGTTVRIDWKADKPEHYAVYLNCNTSLIDSFRSLFPELCYEGNRAIILHREEELPHQALKTCIQMALRYHLDKHKEHTGL